MQLLKIVLYRQDGRTRELKFLPGKLNIVTGRSRTGKSVLLTIVDYCLGRDRVQMPPGIIRKQVRWFATLWELDSGSRVLLARPALEEGRAETSNMMLEFGGPGMDVPDFENLVVNTDSKSARTQVGARLGLADARLAAPEDSLKADSDVTLGAAAFYLFQEQHEIANKAMLFHRQNERGVEATISDSLPFFLGALPGDNAAKQLQLRNVKRGLRAARKQLSEARDDADDMSVKITSLLAEAHEAGMVSVAGAPDTPTMVGILNALRFGEAEELALDADLESQDRRRALENERRLLRSELGKLLDDRSMMLDIGRGQGGFGHAIGQQIQRLSSIGLMEHADTGDRTACPVCQQKLGIPDPGVDQLNQRLASLRSELELMARAEPARHAALQSIDSEAMHIRERLASLDAAFRQFEVADSESVVRTGVDRREFVRGRIDAILSQYQAADDTFIQQLLSRIDSLERQVRALEDELDDSIADFRLSEVVTRLSKRIAEIAAALDVEYAEDGVWLDLKRLTVVLSTNSGPVSLENIGSGANWVGLHLAVHLALHEFFIEQNSPVPRLLMLDQPTQVFYESKYVGATKYVGVDENTADDDHDAVAHMFRLMYDIVEKHAPGLQIIVSDHANLDEPWFAESVRYNWRNGDGLIPSSWVD